MQQFDGSVLKSVGQDIASKVNSRDGTEVSVAKPGGEAIRLVVAIRHVVQALQQLNVELDPEDPESLGAARDQANKVKVELDLDETTCLQQFLMGSFTTGKKTAELFALQVSFTCILALLWNNRIVRWARLHQL